MRHGRGLLDADADQPLEHLDVRGAAQVVARAAAVAGQGGGRA
ncbi:hypothetical protein ACGFW5_33140 [Streptomyces sp. NPDC048416]